MKHGRSYRDFQYPDDTEVSPQINEEKYTEGTASAENNVIGCDSFAEAAEDALKRGEYEAAHELFLQSVTEMRNVESLRRLGEMYGAAFVQQYRFSGYDGNDAGTDFTVGTAVAFLLAYAKLKESTTGMEDTLWQIAKTFNYDRDFEAIVRPIRQKVEMYDTQTLINEFYTKGK